MKDHLRIFPMKALAALSLYLMFFPVCLLMGRYFLPESEFLWYALPLAATIWGTITYLFPSKILRVLIPVIGAAAILAFGVFELAADGFLRFLPVIPCAAIIFLIPPAWSALPWDEWHPAFWLLGVLFHLLSQFLATFPAFSGTAQALAIAFVIYAFITALMLNSKGMRNGMHGSQKAPTAMKTRNRLLVIALFIPAFLASCWGILQKALSAVSIFLRDLIIGFIKWFLALFSFADREVTGESSGGQADSFMGGEVSPPSAFAVFMEKVLMGIAFILMAIALYFLIKIIWKKLKHLWQMIMDRLRKYAAAVNEDYVDEAESTLNLDETKKVLREKLQKAFTRAPRQIPWNELDGRGRVRRLYQQFLKKKPDLSAMTAREALSQEKWMGKEQAEQFTFLYEQARYSDHDISAETADQLKNAIK